MLIFSPRLFVVAILANLSIWQAVFAAPVPPPYIALTEADNLSFPQKTCQQIAQEVLTSQGFARVTPEPNAPTVFAAYKTGKDYEFKAAIKCRPEDNLVIVVVVAGKSGAQAKADELLNEIRLAATAVPPEQPATAPAKPTA